jgi:hypothetical protein
MLFKTHLIASYQLTLEIGGDEFDQLLTPQLAGIMQLNVVAHGDRK